MFRMSINGVQMNDLPENLDDSKIKIVRDSKIKFLSANYIADLKFHGDSYQAILALYVSNVGCGFIPAVIQKKCGQIWSTYFSGVIDLSTIKHNLSRCWITASIEDENLSALIIKRKGISVPAAAVKSISGTTIAAASPYAITIINYPITTTNTRDVWNVFQALQHIVRYITDGAVDVVSDFFQTTTSQQEKYNIFQDLTVSAAYNYNDAFNQAVLILLSNPPGYTIGDLAEAFGYTSAQAPFDYNHTFMSSVVTGANNIQLTSPLPMDLANRTGIFSTVTKTQSIITGGKNLTITNGARLRSTAGTNDEDLILSFEELFSELDRIFNLSFRMEKIGGQIFLRLEPLEYFFDNANVLTKTEVPEIIETPNDDYAYNFINTGEKGALIPSLQLQGWASDQNCAEDGINIETKFITDGDLIDRQVIANTDDNKDKEIYLMETEPHIAPGTFRTTNYHLEQYFGGVLVAVFNIKNAFLDNYHRIINHMFGSGGDYTREGRTLTNNSAYIFAKEASFKSPLNETEIQTLLAGLTDFISFADGQGNSGQGWILEIEIENRSGISDFKLLTE